MVNRYGTHVKCIFIYLSLNGQPLWKNVPACNRNNCPSTGHLTKYA